MGLLDCKKHGLTSFLEVEDSICEKIHAGEELFDEDLDVIRITWLFRMEGMEDDLQYFDYIVSKETKDRLGFQDEYILQEDDEDVDTSPLNLKILCSKCFYEYPYRENLSSLLEKYYRQ
ncbi:MAG: hypothetical protein LBU84_19790 [Prevotella sp.]|jgi:hypothetical protein|nr:hypothetical protein [Prevotella sp.]